MARDHAAEYRNTLDNKEEYGAAFDKMFDNPLDKLDDLKIREGTCGYDKNGNINPEDTSSKTPGGLKSMPADKRTQMVKNIMEKKCKHCNCKCHCNVKEHGDMYGLCSCLTCEHETEECEACE